MGGTAPRVGLVLGAGGVAGGAFHAGVLAALQEVTGWDPRRAEIIVGTSAGSITATSLRAGLSAPDLLARNEGRPLSAAGARLTSGGASRPPLRPAPRRRDAGEFATMLSRAIARPLAARPAALLAGLLPEGNVSTEMISTAIGGLFPADWPEAPLRVCTVRRDDGRRVVFGTRPPLPPLADAVAASCAIPGFYQPVVIDGEAYLDGGVHSPTNADVLLDEDVALDLVVVSSPMSQRGLRVGLSVRDAVRRWSGLLLDHEVRRLRRRGLVVVAFEPDADDVAVMGPNAMDPHRRADVARQARSSARRRLAEPGVASHFAASPA